jgi:hypothetical protein
VLGASGRRSFDVDGYVVVHGAISRDDAAATVELICSHLGADVDDPATWYRPHPDRHGIMVQLFQHEQLQRNRTAPRVAAAFAQLLGRSDLYPLSDRVGFNPPINDRFAFPGPHLHWDVDLVPPVPFGLQGILYLTDTPPEQGALAVVPGFHHRIESWLAGLPAGVDPQHEDLDALGPRAVGADAGDLVVWHQALPHGATPNRGRSPRFVQYVNHLPIGRGATAP